MKELGGWIHRKVRWKPHNVLDEGSWKTEKRFDLNCFDKGYGWILRSRTDEIVNMTNSEGRVIKWVIKIDGNLNRVNWVIARWSRVSVVLDNLTMTNVCPRLSYFIQKVQLYVFNGVAYRFNTFREGLERLKKIRVHRGLRHYWELRDNQLYIKTTVIWL